MKSAASGRWGTAICNCFAMVRAAGALMDRCCHRSAPLSMGTVVEEGVRRAYHGLVIADARARSYPVVEKDRMVWVWTGDPARADCTKIVDFPYHNDPGKWPNKHDVYPIKAKYMLMVDNLMDLTHLGYLHAKTVGGNPAPMSTPK
jgi:phenylpropionate dioxygenase-like ring-hydroxylating dioxygenase large terminal subunit